ncbi:MAG: type I glutamate--ammonia ligase [Desulfobacula sp.]|jgi:glutamine synthetase|uniref:type I glutamate--ammonia ligase n=1 Tax=Desulfobacula sp. TaxID=2593537 RepID=UPI001D44E883|nr:type I glutamate--ammonia ligase [Desulfobacula sp.]MBT3484883.1 type I glutamate--ammonia ligase [Desulfobacula sp.]MBT3804647.1 type I glutamate--ammonia ligase [Desulfobacula sp.]MBT4023997.1 type I glutamate--ammonia ligase [Desulfobacula sp.]MBT4198359.1 type I glutamate--ammonia ligase [Desulfobacula sp.]
MTPKDVLAMIKENNVKVVDLRYMDFIGTWQHFSVPICEFGESAFEDGFGFDGSSMRAWQNIDNSDMLVIPEPGTAKIDPFFKVPTLAIIGNIHDPITMEAYSRDPRGIAKKVEQYIKSTGIGDTIYVGPEPEFFIFGSIRYSSEPNASFFEIDSPEAHWNTGAEEMPNLGYKIRPKSGYFPLPPADKYQDMRTEMMITLEDLGIAMECQHHEVGAAGQSEIDLRFDSLLKMGDSLAWFKYVLRNVAAKYDHTVTFMPKPLYGDNGTGMHTHMSFWKDGVPLFAGNKYAGMSQDALYAIGGIMKHCKALCAITNPTTNSYKRLVPGFEAPINLAYSSRNRSAAIRLPMYSGSPKAKRIEFRTPDPSCNGYMAFAAIAMAMIDGIQNKIDPGDPMDKNIYDLPPEELAEMESAPGSLEEALDALKHDHDFLLKGDVFTKDVIEYWIDYKMENEVKPVISRPHPHEFYLYYDI